ncbi:arf-GAP with coiled- ANK repeat and PH domain-containing 1-like protein [Labeo rohita]|uniref:Arf-GAP with coiled-coil, ANK repeat and PH domain-containing protein n=1 Tax=Labeo rohita TaxID=84645 RepID=A0A498MN08_LABRO|nr:arf-GAP with coiled- ANK repeat and PH domain-containing 1-like protein [Labeo rohita]
MSPQRAEIEKVEVNVNELETRLEKLVKQCHTMLDAGRAYCQNSKSFVNGLKELGHHCSEDRTMGEVIETTQKSVKSKLQNFVKEDVKRFKDVRKEFERSSENLEAALSRNAQAPRGKQHEVEESSNNLLNARRAFRSGALDYVLQINVIESRKKTEILMAMLSLMEAQALFFQQGYQSLTELENYRKQLSDEYTQLVLNSAREKRDMEQRHGAVKKKVDVSYDDSIMDFSPDAPNGIAMEGYLYKRASNAFKTWSRRWFSIQKNQLVYQKKHNRDRCSSVSAGSVRLSSGEPETSGREALEEVQAISGNGQCCDCGEPGPDWASINLGITLCITCSGIHRSLGVHFSKVRSLTLDSWEPELVKLMCELGNTAINKIYEARIEEITIKKPHPSSPRQDKESWIRSKYVEKKFIHKLPETGRGTVLRRSSARRNRSNTQDKPNTRPPLKPKPNRATLPRLTDNDEEEDLSGLHPGALLYRSAAMQHFPLMADALAHGADVNWVNVAEDSKTPLIQAAMVNSLAACEFLLQNGANVNQVDSNGRGPLHHATILGHTGLVCLFLKRGADYNAKDMDDKDPIGIAIDNANADIVTLLRIAKMNKEMREMDGTPSGHSEGQGSGGGGGTGSVIGHTKKSFQTIKNHLSGRAPGGQN